MDNELLHKAYDLLETKKNGTVITGFQDLDFMLANLDKGSVITIGGRPAMGKTSLVTSILFNLLDKEKKCVYYSLDISSTCFVQRLMFSKAEICSQLLRQGKLKDNDWEKLAKTMDYFSEKQLFIHDKTVDTKEIRTQIQEIKPEYVFVDYLQIIKSSSKKQKNEAIDGIISELKQIAKDNDCIIFVLSSLSRAVENRYDKRPLLSDLRDGGSIEDVSDAVLFIYRDEYYKSEEESYLPKGHTDIIIAKNKFGPVGIINLLFKCEYMKFKEPFSNGMF